ncbi:MAG: hypothetical protein GYA58_04590, partial [Anaerolineaceae bacterium]|nr:hypothetical protein [Anaerolineaceae bacterium]
YETGEKQAQYREGIYVGYRYYEKVQKPVAFPFGFGLSYTQFTYSQLTLSQTRFQPGEKLTASLTLRNSGQVAGAEVVQLYVGNPQREDYRPQKELRAFTKVFLNPGEEKPITFTLDARAFARFDNARHVWTLPSGEYSLQIGTSSQEIRLQANVEVIGDAPIPESLPQWYLHPHGKVTQADFEQLLGHSIEPVKPARPGTFTLSSSMRDMQRNWLMKIVIHFVEKSIAKEFGGKIDYDDPNFRMTVETSIGAPIKNMVIFSGGQMSAQVAEGLVQVANHHLWRGFKTMLFGA